MNYIMTLYSMFVIVFSSGYKCRMYVTPENVDRKALELCDKYAKYYNVTHDILEIKSDV